MGIERRRRFLKYAGTAAVSSLAGCLGGEGPPPEESPNERESPTATEAAPPVESPTASAKPADGAATHDVPHPNDNQVPDAEKNAETLNGLRRRSTPSESKSGIGYQHEPLDGKYCGNCSMYVPDQTGDGFGACYLVTGKIHPCDYCILWVEYQGDDAVPCEAA